MFLIVKGYANQPVIEFCSCFGNIKYSEYFLKTGGHFVISIKANCIDSTVPAEAVFASEVKN